MPRSTRLVALLALSIAAAACGKKNDTNSPDGKGKSVAEMDKERAAAQEKAKAKTLVGLANEDLAKGRWVSARDRAKRALEASPNDADAYAVLGTALWRAGDYAGSTKAYKEALELDRKNFGAAVGLGRNYQAAGDHKAAVELQDEILAADDKQIDPLLTKLWSYYATTDAANSVKTLDQLFKLVDQANPLLPLLQMQAAFMRPLEGKGDLIKVEGKGTSDLQIDPVQGLRHAGGTVGGEFTRVVFFELREEVRIDKNLATKLKLKELGKLRPVGAEADAGVVLIPEIKFGDLKISNVPAIVEDLSPYGTIGETPGIVLSRQAMHRIGTITFDFPNATLQVDAAAPTAAPAGSTETQFLLLDLHVLLVPAISVALDGANFSFFAWFGGPYGSSISVAKKEFLKSGHLPRELDPLDDPANGLKMVYLDQAKVGALQTRGLGGLVLANTPPDGQLAQVVELSGFELGGYINHPLIKTMKVTYALAQGKMYLAPRGK